MGLGSTDTAKKGKEKKDKKRKYIENIYNDNEEKRITVIMGRI